MNNKYELEVEHPLLRAGFKIKTEASERYVVPVTRKLFELVREINEEVVRMPKNKDKKGKEKKKSKKS